MTGSKIFYNSSFKNYRFVGVNLSNTTIGSYQGVYEDCLFEQCTFKGKGVDHTHFLNSSFINTTFKTVNLNGSTFHNCSFTGKLTDVSFNGIYDTNPVKNACLEKVDFSGAVFGDFVTFYNCELSTCILPKGTTFAELLYPIYSNDPTVLSTGSKDRIVLTRK